MKRSDIHRPSAIIPEEYAFVACDYIGGGIEAMGFISERQAFRAHLTATGGKFAEHFNSGSCHICGAGAVYLARFHHLPTNTYITTGMNCAEKMGMDDPVYFRSFKKRVAAGLKAKRGKAKARDLLASFGLSDAWAIYEHDDAGKEFRADSILPKQEGTIIDIARKVVQYGTISDPQAAFVARLLQQIKDRPALEAKRAAETAAAAPVPATETRMDVTATVLSTRSEEGPYGATVKMLVQHESGYKLWGTVPSNLLGQGSVVKGAVVAFSAKVQRSDKDEKFGFFNRPTKARIVRAAEAQT